MKTTLPLLVLLQSMAAACAACSTPKTHGPNARFGDPSPTSRDLVARGSQPDERLESESPEGYQFVPTSHPPHGALAVAQVDYHALPRLVRRSCFQERYEERTYSPYSGGYGLGRAGSGGAAPVKRRASSAGAGPLPPPAPVAQAAPAAEAYDGAQSNRSAPPTADHAAPKGYSEGEAKEKAVAPRERREQVRSEPVPPAADDYHAWGGRIYLSNDDSMSLSSAQRILFAIDNYQALPVEHIRPHELLNYFSFDYQDVGSSNDFSVLGSLDEKPGKASEYTLGLSVTGRGVTRDSRRNVALSLVLDRSGSMNEEGRMGYLKDGLLRMVDELKSGDLVNLTLFDHEVCVPLENFVVGRDSSDILRGVIRELTPRGSTDLNAGLRRGYELANASHVDGYSNRVLMITDALANTGTTDPEIISNISESYDRRQIRLSAVGVGRDFNDELLNRLTERGKGAYVFLGSSAEVDAVFGARFPSLIETVANDVHFRLNLPPSLRMNVFYGEESSTHKEDVQAIHYFAGTNQLFLSDLVARDEDLNEADSLMLSIEYKDPETNRDRLEEYAFTLGELRREVRNVRKGRLIMSFVDGLRDIASRTPTRMGYGRAQWEDAGASEQCRMGKQSLREQAAAVGSDPEVDRVVKLWDKFCDRYPEVVNPPPPRPRPMREPVRDPERDPVRRDPPTGRDVWPSAQR